MRHKLGRKKMCLSESRSHVVLICGLFCRRGIHLPTEHTSADTHIDTVAEHAPSRLLASVQLISTHQSILMQRTRETMSATDIFKICRQLTGGCCRSSEDCRLKYGKLSFTISLAHTPMGLRPCSPLDFRLPGNPLVPPRR